MTCSEKNVKKEARTLKWYKISSKKASFFLLPSSLNCSKNASQSTATDVIFLTDSQETFKTGKSSKNNFHRTWLSETWFTSIVLLTSWSKELCNVQNSPADQMTIHKRLRKGCRLLRMKPFQSLRISKTEATASRWMLESQGTMFTKN